MKMTANGFLLTSQVMGNINDVCPLTPHLLYH